MLACKTRESTATVVPDEGPNEQIVSSLRMQRRKQGLQDSAGENQALRDLCRERPERIHLRGDYGHTLTALEDSFGLSTASLPPMSNCFIRTTGLRSASSLGCGTRHRSGSNG